MKCKGLSLVFHLARKEMEGYWRKISSLTASPDVRINLSRACVGWAGGTGIMRTDSCGVIGNEKREIFSLTCLEVDWIGCRESALGHVQDSQEVRREICSTQNELALFNWNLLLVLFRKRTFFLFHPFFPPSLAASILLYILGTLSFFQLVVVSGCNLRTLGFCLVLGSPQAQLEQWFLGYVECWVFATEAFTSLLFCRNA